MHAVSGADMERRTQRSRTSEYQCESLFDDRVEELTYCMGRRVPRHYQAIQLSSPSSQTSNHPYKTCVHPENMIHHGYHKFDGTKRKKYSKGFPKRF